MLRHAVRRLLTNANRYRVLLVGFALLSPPHIVRLRKISCVSQVKFSNVIHFLIRPNRFRRDV